MRSKLCLVSAQVDGTFGADSSWTLCVLQEASDEFPEYYSPSGSPRRTGGRDSAFSNASPMAPLFDLPDGDGDAIQEEELQQIGGEHTQQELSGHPLEEVRGHPLVYVPYETTALPDFLQRTSAPASLCMRGFSPVHRLPLYQFLPCASVKGCCRASQGIWSFGSVLLTLAVHTLTSGFRPAYLRGNSTLQCLDLAQLCLLRFMDARLYGTHTSTVCRCVLKTASLPAVG